MQWISMKDQVPEDGQKVIYYFKPLGMFIGYYERLKGEDAIFGTHCFHSSKGFLTDDVTHWIPLPESPDSVEQENKISDVQSVEFTDDSGKTFFITRDNNALITIEFEYGAYNFNRHIVYTYYVTVELGQETYHITFRKKSDYREFCKIMESLISK